ERYQREDRDRREAQGPAPPVERRPDVGGEGGENEGGDQRDQQQNEPPAGGEGPPRQGQRGDERAEKERGPDPPRPVVEVAGTMAREQPLPEGLKEVRAIGGLRGDPDRLEHARPLAAPRAERLELRDQTDRGDHDRARADQRRIERGA